MARGRPALELLQLGQAGEFLLVLVVAGLGQLPFCARHLLGVGAERRADCRRRPCSLARALGRRLRERRLCARPQGLE